MARPKEFDPAAALHGAAGLFWVHGYAGTSIDQVCRHVGIGRQSLYDTFGDKDALYLQALRGYLADARMRLRAVIDGAGSARDAIRAFLSAGASSACSGDGRGCFLANALGERAGDCPAVRDVALAHLREMEVVLARRISSAQLAGDLPAGRDAHALASYFVHLQFSLALAARALPERTPLDEVVGVALRVLD